MTAYARPEDRERCLAAGYQRYFAKPYSFPELASAIRSLRGSGGGRRRRPMTSAGLLPRQ